MPDSSSDRFGASPLEGLPPADRGRDFADVTSVHLFLCGDCDRRYANPPAPVSRCECGSSDIAVVEYPLRVYTHLRKRQYTDADEMDGRTVPFDPPLLEAVLDGDKTLTVRLGFDGSLEPGDPLVLADAPTRTPFDTATTISQGTLTAGAFVAGGFTGHETYPDMDALRAALEPYYPGAEIDVATTLDVVWFQPHTVGLASAGQQAEAQP